MKTDAFIFDTCSKSFVKNGTRNDEKPTQTALCISYTLSFFSLFLQPLSTTRRVKVKNQGKKKCSPLQRAQNTDKIATTKPKPGSLNTKPGSLNTKPRGLNLNTKPRGLNICKR
jgi:hypothetical protein